MRGRMALGLPQETLCPALTLIYRKDGEDSVKLRKRLQRCLVFALALVLSLGAASATAFASPGSDTDAVSEQVYTRPDITRKASLTLRYHQHDLNFEGVAFQVYKIASMTELARFEFVSGFDNYPVEFPENMTDSDWTNLAETLAGYVERDGLKSDLDGKTDVKGEIKFVDLDAGLYLITGGSHQREYMDGEIKHRVYYHVQPFLVSTPGLDKNSTWCYDMAISPKFNASEDQFISRRVLKSWYDKGFEAYRPELVIVDLLRDGKIFESVELSDKNNWRYTWEELDNQYQWRIVERLVQDYRVSGRQEGSTYVITNRYIDTYTPVTPDKPGDKPTKPTEPGKPTEPTEPSKPTNPVQPVDPGKPTEPVAPVNPVNPVQPVDPVEPSNPVGPTGPKLPQTGQLWWPVPVLAFAGVVLFAGGYLLVKSVRDQDQGGDDACNKADAKKRDGSGTESDGEAR